MNIINLFNPVSTISAKSNAIVDNNVYKYFIRTELPYKEMASIIKSAGGTWHDKYPFSSCWKVSATVVQKLREQGIEVIDVSAFTCKNIDYARSNADEYQISITATFFGDGDWNKLSFYTNEIMSHGECTEYAAKITARFTELLTAKRSQWDKAGVAKAIKQMKDEGFFVIH